VPPTPGQRLRRFLLDGGNRRLDFKHPVTRVLAALAALGIVAALAAVSWMAYVDSRNAAVAVTDPRVVYVSAIRQKIQAATEAALAASTQRGQGGSPTVLIRVNYRGNLISATIIRSSGHAALDELVLRIVRETAPFEPFSLDMRRTTNIVEITSEFNFR
jgi:TonB family protein